VAIQQITCDQCGREGRVGASVADARVVLDVMLGLDPGECEGCRTVLEANGYAVTGVRFNPDGTVHFTPVAVDDEAGESQGGARRKSIDPPTW